MGKNLGMREKRQPSPDGLRRRKTAAPAARFHAAFAPPQDRDRNSADTFGHSGLPADPRVWMVPLGLLALSDEPSAFRRLRRRLVVWWERRHRSNRASDRANRSARQATPSRSSAPRPQTLPDASVWKMCGRARNFSSTAERPARQAASSTQPYSRPTAVSQASRSALRRAEDTGPCPERSRRPCWWPRRQIGRGVRRSRLDHFGNAHEPLRIGTGLQVFQRESRAPRPLSPLRLS